MSPFEFRPAKRQRVPLLIGLAGGTGSGKTMSALRIARGIAGGDPFAGIDTENGRMLHYADRFPELHHARFDPPFRPERYAEAVEAADGAGYKVIVVDSASHEWAGDGGVTDWQIDEYERLGGRDAVKLLSWSAPKQAHKRFVTRLLQVKAHVILCHRAEPKVDLVKNPETGKTEIVPKASLAGVDGWLPVSEKNLPFELTFSAMLFADNPGRPRPIKLPDELADVVNPGNLLDEQVGERLAVWAAGGNEWADEPDVDAVLELAREVGRLDDATAAIAAHRARYGAVSSRWLANLKDRLDQETEGRVA